MKVDEGLQQQQQQPQRSFKPNSGARPKTRSNPDPANMQRTLPTQRSIPKRIDDIIRAELAAIHQFRRMPSDLSLRSFGNIPEESVRSGRDHPNNSHDDSNATGSSGGICMNFDRHDDVTDAADVAPTFAQDSIYDWVAASRAFNPLLSYNKQPKRKTKRRTHTKSTSSCGTADLMTSCIEESDVANGLLSPSDDLVFANSPLHSATEKESGEEEGKEEEEEEGTDIKISITPPSDTCGSFSPILAAPKPLMNQPSKSRPRASRSNPKRAPASKTAQTPAPSKPAEMTSSSSTDDMENFADADQSHRQESFV